MKKEILEKLLPYEEFIIKSKFNQGFYFIFENFSKILKQVYSDIYISGDVFSVPDNIFKIINMSKNGHFILKNIYIVEDKNEQKVKFIGNNKEICLNYNILKKTESEVFYYIIKSLSEKYAISLVDIMLKSTNLSYNMISMKKVIEEASKIETSLDKLIYIYLTALTMQYGGGFNRAIFFKKDNNNNYEIFRAIGFKNENEAYSVWEFLDKINYDFDAAIKNYSKDKYFSSLEEKIIGLKISKDVIGNVDNIPLIMSANKVPITIRNYLDLHNEFAVLSLKTENNEIGFILVDNRYTKKKITEDQLYFLDFLSKQFTILWENKIYIESLSLEAKKDFLTGFYNRRCFDKYINSIIESNKKNIGIVIIDMDNFKKVNDEYGHYMGDELLRNISEIILNNIRETDRAFRYGGDEFILIFENISKKDLSNILERIKNSYYKKTGYTFSAGAVICENPEEINKYIKKADEVLYISKKEYKGDFVIR
ncbi:GGDEF domain-containing protein [Marinitoga sp. 38H-ov]|uniref:GGDEF domain-containing protein n=1 Tax=Marinitoga sp. 38H-ov TaxID=1755814 RepID=UPI0013EDF14B|nr:GGDEF domain-containing protein [Marinitoga sp. 38H-ov]KAF2956560.1 hypothetical protein AS160_05020 [Marinitoga sp. 38H-ov]